MTPPIGLGLQENKAGQGKWHGRRERIGMGREVGWPRLGSVGESVN